MPDGGNQRHAEQAMPLVGTNSRRRPPARANASPERGARGWISSAILFQQSPFLLRHWTTTRQPLLSPGGWRVSLADQDVGRNGQGNKTDYDVDENIANNDAGVR